MRAVTIGVTRGTDLALINGPTGVGAIDEPARADQLVVAVRFLKLLTGLAGAVPVRGRLEQHDVFFVVIAAAEPAAQQRVLGPVAAARPRPVGRLGVLQRRVFGRNAAVDDADNDVLAVEPGRAAQAAVAIKKDPENPG